MYNKDEIKSLILKNQEKSLESMLDNIEEVMHSKDIDNMSKLLEIQELSKVFEKMKEKLISEDDFDRWINDSHIIDANNNALSYVQKEDIPEYMRRHSIEGFLVGYIGEHVRLCNILESMNDEKVSQFLK